MKLLNDLCMKDDHADVSFIVENTKIPAHKMILSARCSYFQSMLFAGFSESKKAEIPLNVPLDAFKAILKYIYTGCLSLAALDCHVIVDIYDLANQYGFDSLKNSLLKYLAGNLTLERCVYILNATILYSMDDLQATCMKFLDSNSIGLLEHDIFKALSLKSLCALLKRNTFYAEEIAIFKAICNWSKDNPEDDIKVSSDENHSSRLQTKQYCIHEI